MRYRVKSAEGELTFESFGEVEKAWLSGLVEPSDEVLEEGTTKWRKAASIPQLARARRTGNQAWGGTQGVWIITGIIFGSASLYLIAKGMWLFGLILGFAVGFLLIHVTMRAFKRTRPY